MKQGTQVDRADMIQAFWAYLSDRAGYTVQLNYLAMLTQQECEQFDVALADTRIRSRK